MRRRNSRTLLRNTILLLLGIVLYCIADTPFAYASQPLQPVNPGYGGYRGRPVLRRLPGGRAMRVLSIGRGSLSATACHQSKDIPFEFHDWREPEAAAISSSSPILLPIPGTTVVPNADLAIPFVCVTGNIESAEAISPDGDILPALTLTGIEQIVTIPLEAYAVPGTWKLVISSGTEFTQPVTVPQITKPTLIVSGDKVMMGGLQPNEEVFGIILADICNSSGLSPADNSDCKPFGTTNPHLWIYDAEFQVSANPDGFVTISRVDASDLDKAYIFLGEKTEGYVASISPPEDFSDAVQSLDRSSLFADTSTDESDVVDRNPVATPAVMPETGSNLSSNITGAVLVTLIGALLILGQLAFIERKRK